MPGTAVLALAARLYFPCAHDPGEQPPRPNTELQAAARAEIRTVVADLGGSPAFASYLIAVAVRESRLTPGVIHVGDARASAAAYTRLRAQHVARGHPLADRSELWLSYGLFGMNSNYHAGAVADPRELCTVVGAVGAYAIQAREVVRRMRRACVRAPTWGDVHRAVQRGVLCPDGRVERIRGARVRLAPGDLGGGG